MLEAFVDATLAALPAGEAPGPVAATVLLRVYATTGREDLGDAVGRLLASAAARPHEDESIAEQADWLRLYAEAARLSDDVRLRQAAEALATLLRRSWEVDTSFAGRALGVHAVLSASSIVDARQFVPAAVDELERLVARDYSPGEGLRGRTVVEAVAVALALLAAFDVTGRLAYPMLAEEVMRAIRPAVASAPPSTGCAAARVFGRLALLHDDHGYRATAVLAPGADYGAESDAVLDAVADACTAPDDAAAYALALTERGDRS